MSKLIKLQLDRCHISLCAIRDNKLNSMAISEELDLKTAIAEARRKPAKFGLKVLEIYEKEGRSYTLTETALKQMPEYAAKESKLAKDKKICNAKMETARKVLTDEINRIMDLLYLAQGDEALNMIESFKKFAEKVKA